MEEVKLSPEELKEAIEFGKLLGSGFFSSVFTYKGRLIKMNNTLYGLLRANSPRLATKVVRDRYRWEKKDFNDREQLEELAKRQPLIRPRVPEGIITFKDVGDGIDGVSPGIIIPHFEGYEDISKMSKTDYKRFLIILRKIFDDIKNLADNEIAQEDLIHSARKFHPNQPTVHGYNVLQKDDDAQIIDMSGPFIKVGKDFEGANIMYQQFANLINDYYLANGLNSVYQKGMNITEDDLARMITELDKATRRK